MKKLLMVRDSAWGRVGLLLVALLMVLWFFGFTAHERQTAGLAAAHYVGYAIPAVALGGAWGWIWYSRSQWLWATAVLLAATLAAVSQH